MKRGPTGPDRPRKQDFVRARRALEPRLGYPESLPIAARREEIAGLIEAHPVVVVCGETGSGKTTQLPKICLGIGRGIRGMIGHTQPRRLAARSVAARIAEETGMVLGEGVGYQVRFDDQSAPATRVKVMTDGILLNELAFDRRLARYDTLIIDEAHERSLNIDFLLGYLRRLLTERRDLKLVITSATIDPERFAKHFDDAPVVEVSGRGYPVEVRYDDHAAGGELADAVVDAARGLMAELPEGDILVFLPGEREIRETAVALERASLGSRGESPRGSSGWEILPLYGRLSETAQGRVFRPGRRRRIVLATNVAETSLTVPRIMAVIDSGLARISRYSYRSKIQRLQVEPVSRASAAQRAGRCGRLAPGVCVRLYSEEDYAARPAFTDPEIRRTNLASVILQMAASRLGDIGDFPFIDPPDARFVQDGYRLLRELEAMDEAGEVSSLGRAMARLPVDPRMARMLLAAAEKEELREALVIVAGLAGQDPRQYGMEDAAKARSAQAEFEDPGSDFVTLANIWRAWQTERRRSSRRQAERWCERHFLSPRRLREWGEIHAQLRGLCREAGLHVGRGRGDREALHRSLLTGLLSHIGRRDEATRYDGARGSAFLLHPTSGLTAKPPAWLVAMEIVKTTRLYARTAAAVDPAWIRDAAAHLVQRSYEGAHWNPKRGRVEAAETITLFGLILEAGRSIDYGPVAPGEARRIFIREALVRGRASFSEKFWRHNQEVLAAIRAREGESRRSWVIPDSELAERYASDIPTSIVDLAGFRRWYRRERRRRPEILCFRESELVQSGYEDPADRLPATVELIGQTLPVEYRFRPGEADDGASVRVPRVALDQLSQEALDRAVPQLVAERAELRLRALPKALRRRLQPIGETARTFAARFIAMPGGGPLEQALADFLATEYGLTPEAGTDPGGVEPDHVRLRVVVTDGEGKEILAGRRLADLRRRLGPTVTGASEESTAAPPVTAWEFGVIPPISERVAGGVTLRRFPALEDRGKGVVLTDRPDREAAARSHRDGVRRLLMLALPQQCRLLERLVTADRRLQLAAVSSGIGESVGEDFVAAAFDRAFPPAARAEVRDAAGFDRLLERGRSELVPAGEALADTLAEVLEARHSAARAAAGLPGNLADVRDDIEAQLSALVYPGFLAATAPERLGSLPRYLRAAELRAQRLPAGAERDREAAAAVGVCLSRLGQLEERAASLDAKRRSMIDEYRWGIEELRVSLFAQQLGTRGKVSPQRLEKLWLKIVGVST